MKRIQPPASRACRPNADLALSAPTCHPAGVQDGPKPQSKLARVCWTITTLAFLLGAISLLAKGDTAYGIVTLVVALCAAINLL